MKGEIFTRAILKEIREEMGHQLLSMCTRSGFYTIGFLGGFEPAKGRKNDQRGKKRQEKTDGQQKPHARGALMRGQSEA